VPYREAAEFPTGIKDVVAMFEGVTQIAMKKAPIIVVIYNKRVKASDYSQNPSQNQSFKTACYP
jgi:hypothetical protein